MWKPNASCLSYNLVVVMLLLSSLVNRRSSEEATEVQLKEASEIVYSLRNGELFGVDIRDEFIKSFIIERDKVINITI